MSKVQLAGNASGTGIFTIASPNSNTDRTLTLPDATGTVQLSGNPISGTTGTFSGLIYANGGGVQFPASQVASGDANCLDDYEEGTWTPALTGATFSTTSSGTYVKVGQVVTVWGYMSFSYSSPTGAFYLNNLPFTVYNDSNVRGGAGTVMCQSGVNFTNYVTTEPINNAVISYFEDNRANTSRTDMGSSNFSAGGSVIRFTITYRTSA